MPATVVIALMAAPVLLLVLLRINAALVFLGLCLGVVLVQFSGDDAISILSGASTNVHTSDSVTKLVLLLAPAVLTMLFMIGTVKRSRYLLNILPAAGVGLLTALLVVPLLPPGTAHNVVHSSVWHNIQSFQSGIVALSALVCLLFLLLQRPKHHDEKHGKKHKG